MRKVYLLLIVALSTIFVQAQTYEEIDVIYQHLGRSDQFGKVIWGIGDACSDDSETGGFTSSSEPLLQNWSKFTHDRCDDYLYGFWQTSYNAINLCNKVISGDTIPAQRKAEARFVRSLQYYYLVNIFNNIPVFTEEFDPEFNQQAFSSKTEVLAFIDNDLQTALTDLPYEYTVDEKYRATKGAALTLLAKVALMQQDYAKTINYADQIINSGIYALEANFADNFSVTNENGAESIFEIEQFDVSANISFYANDGLNYHNYMQSPKGKKHNCPTLNLLNEFEVGDLRLGTTIFQNGDKDGDTLTIWTSASPTGLYARKYYVSSTDHNGDEFIPKNIKVFRYADVLLMAAEARCYLGDIANAGMYLDMIRTRAGLTSVVASTMEECLDAIRHERRVELAMEGHRFFDLQRYHSAGVLDMKSILLASGVTGAENFVSGTNEVFPIPYHVLNTNPNAMQNPGYGYFECTSVDNPYRELTVSANIQESAFDIVNVFCGAPEITGNTNEGLLSASIQDSLIVFTYIADQVGEATITLKDYCGIYPIKETITIKVVATEPVEETNITINETVDKTTSFVISTTVFDNQGLTTGVTYTATLADGSPLPDWITFDPETLTFTINENASQAIEVSKSTLKSGSTVTSLDLLIVASDDNGTTAAVEYTAEIKGAPTDVFVSDTNMEVFVYPNPNNGLFRINTGGQKGCLKIFSVSGRLVYENKNISSGESISLLNLSKDIYLYQFEAKDAICNGKIVIK